MASDHSIRRYLRWYAKLLRLYPKAYRERFAAPMEQTFNDLCRERMKSGRGLLSLASWAFFETTTGIIRENATILMKQGSTPSLNFVKYSGIAISILMVAGIVTLMILARGTGEDIAGIVAMALVVTIVSSVGAIIAAVLQKRAQRAN